MTYAVHNSRKRNRRLLRSFEIAAHWRGEIGPNPAQLVQVGWGRKRSEAALVPGTEVTLTLAPSFAGTLAGLVSKIVNAQVQNLLGMRESTGAGEGGGERGKKQ